jgi:hypothetical protein
MKQFVKALNKEEGCFKYIRKKFPAVTQAKLTDPNISKLLADATFESTVNATGKVA